MAPAPIADRLERVARRHVERALPPDPSGELAAMGLSSLLMVYGNWRGRFVPRRARKVHLANELVVELRDAEYRPAVERACAEIASGVDLTPRLSKGVEVAYVADRDRQADGGVDRDIDAMLAHDGLHHLHLGDDEGGRFVTRTGNLLFVAFRDTDAYVVGVYPHGSWGRRDLLERVVRNWPEADLLAHMSGVTSLSQEHSDEERWELMKAGVSVGITIDGKVYFPLGQTTAGTPIAVTQRVNAFMWELNYMREQGVDERLRLRGADPGLYWVPQVHDEHIGLSSSQGFVAFGRLS